MCVLRVSDERGASAFAFWCQTSLVISFGFGDYSLRLTENGVPGQLAAGLANKYHGQYTLQDRCCVRNCRAELPSMAGLQVA